MTKQIIGIDPSLTGTGICVCDAAGETFKPTYLTTIKTTAKKDHYQRFELILSSLEHLGFVNKEKTCLVGIEDIAFLAFGQGFSALCELQGIVRFEMYKKSQSYVGIAPTSLKKFISGSGNCKKNMIPLAAQKKYTATLLEAGLGIEDDNQADALGIANLAWLWHNRKGISKADEAIVSKLHFYDSSLLKK